MGLCKCRVVTTLFCFQHRVNVCENCLVSEHPTCVVKTYLQWLQHSDFDPTCSLCHEIMDESTQKENPVIRLTCHDVFHVECLDKYVKTRFPPHTAPAGYTCPACQGRIVPPENVSSPVATAARRALSQLTWAASAASVQTHKRSTLSPPSSMTKTTTATSGQAPRASHRNRGEKEATDVAHHARGMDTQPAGRTGEPAPPATHTSRPAPAIPSRAAYSADSTSLDMPLHSARSNSSFGSRGPVEDKYARRPANAWFAQLVGNRVSARKQVDPNAGFKRAAVILFLVVVGLVTVIEVRSFGEQCQQRTAQCNTTRHKHNGET
eukprot:m.141652 g.141652  ORF g.141652 m.141652 type:complete len:322 (+) comp17124_c0_seq3:192-1157(+)